MSRTPPFTLIESMRGKIASDEGAVAVPSAFATVTGPLTVFGTVNVTVVGVAAQLVHATTPLTLTETGPCAVKFAPFT